MKKNQINYANTMKKPVQSVKISQVLKIEKSNPVAGLVVTALNSTVKSPKGPTSPKMTSSF